ncbi:methionine--tRNA ligase [Candidatus Saccharibacteria bacterium]|nr:methionine--tRNA ligase [Candidatus Saccharibacteria bacterium]
MKTYVTTAIPYVNGAPHLGHAEDYLLADIAARYMRMHGDEVKFQVGTDEHGNKIEKKAAELGLDVKKYVDENSAKFKEFIKKLGVEYTDFIRTTDESHEALVQKIWQKLAPHIYKSDYEGFYCEGCERFVTDTEYKENNGICPDHQKPYEHLKESNYYFKVSDFKSEIKEKIEKDELKIIPEFRKNEILKLLADTPDVSISRPKAHLKWGVEVPDDDEQVMYVWMDALSNYITVLGFPDKDISDFWPATVQIVGKDILRFHAILWPAMLLGLGLPLPKTLLCHGFILANGQKMSKSIGNVVDPIEVLEKHGLDAFRYYFSRHIDTFADSDFTWEKYESAYNNELANDYGNLVQRLSNLCNKNSVDRAFLEKRKVLEDGKFKNTWDSDDAEYKIYMDNFEFSKGIEYAWEKIQAINKRIEDTKPWSVAKENPDEAKILLASLVGDLLNANEMLKPFLPAAEKVDKIFTSKEITPPKEPLFPKEFKK